MYDFSHSLREAVFLFVSRRTTRMPRRPEEFRPGHRVTGGGRPPPVPTERGVRISRTTLFGGPDPPAAVFFYSPDRSGEHPERHLAGYTGLMQADAYAGFNRLYEAGRKPGPIVEAACWAHARRKFFDLARLNKAPIAD